MVLRKILDHMYHHTKSVISLGNNEVLKTLTKTLTFVDADTTVDANVNPNADGSTRALRKCDSGELKNIQTFCLKKASYLELCCRYSLESLQSDNSNEYLSMYF